LPPQESNVIVGNLVYSNNNPDTPAIDAALLAMGNGILVAGGNKNLIVRNRVWDHDITGIGVVPNADKKIWMVSGNMVKENDVSDSRLADLGLFAEEESWQLLRRKRVHHEQAGRHRKGTAVFRSRVCSFQQRSLTVGRADHT